MIVTQASLAALMTSFRQDFTTAFADFKAKTAYERIATVVPSTTASNTYGWLGEFPGLREWIGERALQDMQTHSYALENKSFEGTVYVKRTDIEDDNLGLYTPRFQMMGQRAAQQPDQMIFNLLKQGRTTACYDGQYFFDTDHPSFDASGNQVTVSNVNDVGSAGAWWYLMDASQALKPMIFQQRKAAEFVAKENQQTSDHVFMKNEYLFGVDTRCNVGFGFWQMAYASNAELNGDALDAAFEVMRSRYDRAGEPLNITPTLLVVPPQLRAAANQTVKVQLGAGGATNANFNAVDVLDTNWLR